MDTGAQASVWMRVFRALGADPGGQVLGHVVTACELVGKCPTGPPAAAPCPRLLAAPRPLHPTLLPTRVSGAAGFVGGRLVGVRWYLSRGPPAARNVEHLSVC